MIASTWLDLVVVWTSISRWCRCRRRCRRPSRTPFVGMVSTPRARDGDRHLQHHRDGDGRLLQGPVLIWGCPPTPPARRRRTASSSRTSSSPGTMWTPMPKAPSHPSVGQDAPRPPPVAPAGDAVMITGSKTVTTMGSNQCRLGDLAMSCAEPVRLPPPPSSPSPRGRSCWSAGPPVDGLPRPWPSSTTKTIANELHGLVGRIKSPRLRNFCHWLVCTPSPATLSTSPPDVMTSRHRLGAPGPIPHLRAALQLRLGRTETHRSGNGWSHSPRPGRLIERGCVVYRAGDGREVEFDTFPCPTTPCDRATRCGDPFNRLTLRNTAPFAWEVETPEGLTHHFATVVAT